MGMFLSKYSMLKALGYNDSGYVLPETKKILGKYKLFALVLHDPKKHIEFDQKFQEIFPRLDYITGEKMLFFGLTNPPETWVRANKGRDYFGIWESEDLLNPANAYTTTDVSLSAYSLANSLDIEFDDLPVLILSNDFQNKTYVVLKTCAQQIENQMMELGYFASSSPYDEIYLNTTVFRDVLKTIDLCGGVSTVINLKESLAKNLSDFLAFAITDQKSNEFQQIIDHRNKLINDSILNVKAQETSSGNFEGKTKLLSYLSLTQTSNEPDYPNHSLSKQSQTYTKREVLYDLGADALECSYDLAADALESSYENKHLKVNKSRLDYESSILLKTTENVISFYNQKYASSEEIDYSPIIIGIGKIFEKEINLSVVHWIRSILEIDLPQYFNKYEPGRAGALILSSATTSNKSARTVDFNKGTIYKWAPPSIGESEQVVSELFEKGNIIDRFDKTSESQLIKSWSAIRRIRNQAAHMNVVDFSNYISILNEFNGLTKYTIFTKMFDLKDLYRGETDKGCLVLTSRNNFIL